MDDCCAVCAEPLEWVAYGPCAHRDVCSTCVVRLRNVCDDRRCCICKSDCDRIFVTKALGDYTKNIDFSSLPVEVREGQMGRYWYHEATQAFFDDVDHYRMIKAMCTFSCSVCDKEGHQNDGGRRKVNFRSLEQLKGHLFHRHRLVMCRLCLQGRKVFICEQRLYTKAQLNQHISTGDSEVDGTESERGGFMGHPACEFCRTPFYGENELYTHMSTEHYTCHICQRQNPGQFEYYKNYDDLEMHFRQGHFLCEDDGCLAKKFTVFPSEAELKRHNAMEHGGRMSRSQRNAVLQIPTSFRYRRNNESGSRRGRGRTSNNRDSSPNSQLSQAIQASLETANSESRSPDPLPSSSTAQQSFSDEESLIDPLVPPLESLAVDSEPPSRYLQAVSHNYSSRGSIGESSFPPLSAPPSNGQQRPQQDGNGLPQNTMAARLRQKNKTTKVNVAQAWPGANRGPTFPSVSSIYSRPVVNNTPASVPGYYSPPTMAAPMGPTPSSYAASTHARPVINAPNWGGSSKARNPSSNGGMKNSTSASNPGRSGSFYPVSDFPPVSSAQTQRSSSGSGSSSQAVKVEDVHTANKSLVERIRIGLNHDEENYASFKDISQEYRQGSVDTWVYLDYVQQFGLLHLVPDLAKLCPDPLKQKELLDAYNSTLHSNESQEMFWGNGSIQVKEKKSNNSKSAKGKKVIDTESSSSSSRPKEALADNVLETVRRLQSGYRESEGEVEVLEKDGYRASKGPVQLGASNQGSSNSRAQNEAPSNGGNSKPSGDGGGSKKGKKTSKFHRARLGDGSVAALLDLRNPVYDPSQDSTDNTSNGQGSAAGLPACSVWRRGGGQRLFGTSKK